MQKVINQIINYKNQSFLWWARCIIGSVLLGIGLNLLMLGIVIAIVHSGLV